MSNKTKRKPTKQEKLERNEHKKMMMNKTIYCWIIGITSVILCILIFSAVFNERKNLNTESSISSETISTKSEINILGTDDGGMHEISVDGGATNPASVSELQQFDNMISESPLD